MVPGHYRSGAPMAHYAEALGVTPTHLTRTLKAATGHSAADLLTERTLHAARSLLAETRQPAQDIARHLGFGSAAYFTRFIQQHTGVTPGKLRRKVT
jgi:AraC family transcriptional activator of pobA